MSPIVFKSIQDVKSWVIGQRKSGHTIGFVPTMGALHAGHVSLLQRASGMCDKVVVSIFVNPTQFNNPDDLEKYPRTMERDLGLLKDAGCDVVFHPEVNEMYPEDEKGHWDFGLASNTLEGNYRPGHFDGVLTIVKKLFEAVNPDKAFFGEKDFQQLALIRKMTEIEHFNIEIVGCPAIRESSGLVMSSRNLRLSESEKRQATEISRVLMEMRDRKEDMSPVDLRAWGRAELQNATGITLEYLEIVDADSFDPVLTWGTAGRPIVLMAAYVGGVRLIDNVYL